MASYIIKGAGRPILDRAKIIDELKRRYPNGSEFTSADDLFAANPDLLPNLKTLKNTAKESFGMPLGKYLTSIGILRKKKSNEKPTVDYSALLEEFTQKIKDRLATMDYVPASIEKLKFKLCDMDFSSAKRWVRRVYNDKTLEQYLQEQDILSAPIDTDEDLEKNNKLLSAFLEKNQSYITEPSKLYFAKVRTVVKNTEKILYAIVSDKNFGNKEKVLLFKSHKDYENLNNYSRARVLNIEENISPDDIKDIRKFYIIEKPNHFKSREILKQKEQKRREAEFYRDLQKIQIERNRQTIYNQLFVDTQNTNTSIQKTKLINVPQKSPIDHENWCFCSSCFRGIASDIYEICKMAGFLDRGINPIIKTELPGIFEIHYYTYGEDITSSIFLEVIKAMPSIKAVSFVRDENVFETYVVYSESGSPYITNYQHVGYLDGKCDWQWDREYFPTEQFFNIDSHDTRTSIPYSVTYEFPYKKEWNDTNYTRVEE